MGVFGAIVLFLLAVVVAFLLLLAGVHWGVHPLLEQLSGNELEFWPVVIALVCIAALCRSNVNVNQT